MKIETTCDAWVVEETRGLYVYTGAKPQYFPHRNTWEGHSTPIQLPTMSGKKPFTLPTGEAVKAKIIVEVEEQ